jgi:hypothetical protein
MRSTLRTTMPGTLLDYCSFARWSVRNVLAEARYFLHMRPLDRQNQLAWLPKTMRM